MSVWSIQVNFQFYFGFSHKIFQLIKAEYFNFNLIIEFKSESQGEKKEV